MKHYEYSKQGINEMYDAVCDECININKVMLSLQQAINLKGTNDNTYQEASKSLGSMIDINIRIGNNTIAIPNNADAIEVLFGALNAIQKDDVGFTKLTRKCKTCRHEFSVATNECKSCCSHSNWEAELPRE